ncbi:hypothetical protein KCV07_g304, partial [Aureobasidium melanogenum]
MPRELHQESLFAFWRQRDTMTELWTTLEPWAQPEGAGSRMIRRVLPATKDITPFLLLSGCHESASTIVPDASHGLATLLSDLTSLFAPSRQRSPQSSSSAYSTDSRTTSVSPCSC